MSDDQSKRFAEEMASVAEYLADPGTLDDKDDAAALLVETVRALRVATAFYNTFIPEDQKYIRHQLYAKTGGFGRALADGDVFDTFESVEQKLAEKAEKAAAAGS